ncbi:MAG TPA: TatD family hydrolase [Bacillota bacterium]|jgi:TatD DNase family protein
MKANKPGAAAGALPPVVETHCHLDLKDYAPDRAEVISRARAAGVAALVNVGFNLASSLASVDLAEANPDIWAAVGIHPHDATEATAGTLARLGDLARKPKVAAIGEIGLDYYRDLSPRPAQREAFRRQLRLARELRKPVIIHDRDAHDEVLRILEEEAAGLTVVLHCFSGDAAMARACLSAGYFMAVGGAVTFANGLKTQEVAKVLPLNRLLLETDSPYLSPEPFRGKRNEPARVAAVAQKVAEVRGESLAVIRAETTRTAVKALGLTLG